MAIVHVALILALAAPAEAMPDPHGADWTAPPPPPAPVSAVPIVSTSTSSTSPYMTSTRPFDPSTPVVIIPHDPPTSSLSRRERKFLWASGGVALAAIPAIVFMTIGIVKMGRLKSQIETEVMENPQGPFPYDLARKYERQQGVVIGTSVASFLLGVTGLALLFVATRRHRHRGPR